MNTQQEVEEVPAPEQVEVKIKKTRNRKKTPTPPNLSYRQYPQAVEIHTRFFEALDKLKEDGQVKTDHQFCKIYQINRGNFSRMRANPQNIGLPVAYLSFLVEDYAVSAHWLITGQGFMMRQ